MQCPVQNQVRNCTEPIFCILCGPPTWCNFLGIIHNLKKTPYFCEFFTSTGNLESVSLLDFFMCSLLSRVRLGTAQSQTSISCVIHSKYTFFTPKNYSIPPFLLFLGPPNNKIPLWFPSILVKFITPRGTWNRA